MIWCFLLLCFSLAWLFFFNDQRSEQHRVFTSPDGRYRVVVIRAEGILSVFPFYSSDRGEVRLCEASTGKILHRKRVESVEIVEQVEWTRTNVDVWFVAEWPLVPTPDLKTQLKKFFPSE
jgi:hypothetical protein